MDASLILPTGPTTSTSNVNRRIDVREPAVMVDRLALAGGRPVACTDAGARGGFTLVEVRLRLAQAGGFDQPDHGRRCGTSLGR